MVVAYCVKCRAKRDIQNPKEITRKVKDRTVIFSQGTCPKCGIKIQRILANKK